MKVYMIWVADEGSCGPRETLSEVAWMDFACDEYTRDESAELWTEAMTKAKEVHDHVRVIVADLDDAVVADAFCDRSAKLTNAREGGGA